MKGLEVENAIYREFFIVFLGGVGVGDAKDASFFVACLYEYP